MYTQRWIERFTVSRLARHGNASSDTHPHKVLLTSVQLAYPAGVHNARRSIESRRGEKARGTPDAAEAGEKIAIRRRSNDENSYTITNYNNSKREYISINCLDEG